MPRIVEQVPEATLCVAGFGPEETALRAQVRDMGLDDRVRFLGAVPQSGLPALYRRAAACVAPFVEAASGDQEGLGLVVAEAIGCGCPVVAGSVPAVRDLLDAGDPGLVDPRNAEALADAVVNVLRNPVVARENAERRRGMIARFDWSRRAIAYQSILSGAMTRR